MVMKVVEQTNTDFMKEENPSVVYGWMFASKKMEEVQQLVSTIHTFLSSLINTSDSTTQEGMLPWRLAENKSSVRLM